MITVIPLDESPVSFKPTPRNPNTKKLQKSVLVYSRKNSPKATLQIRMAFQSAFGWHAEVINVWLSGNEAAKIADALVRRGNNK
jgi:hypothetical protein